MKRALALVAVPAALAVSLAACGGGDDSGDSMAGHSMSSSASPSTGGGQAARHNDQDVMFAQMMIPHHRQAIEMADLAAARAASPEVKSLAADIKKAQTPEIQRLSGWLKGWGASAPSPGMSGMDGMQHGMDGMMSEKDMKGLEAAKGAAFDKAFLGMMIKHHEGAVAMAKTEQSAGQSSEAKSMAAGIVSSQSAEIAKMRSMLKK
ncbi:DUF305 domain-containing protein [Actinomadura opuntiae]|uniref:DUF305 domain-containing protein n=1 Tax=Actinomadura sp. OS1-43 TaxID=604315 RepID=UPI00255A8366|nr:DUF305 domain-containing protein [Actinomadura sp. OS1-43]MDL4815046.1 DUF305 domain-containing protein [Actinomadura sp. OS1-43]